MTKAQSPQANVTCAVQLIDRRTGAAHRVGGAALLLFTRNPDQAVAELLAGRDPAVWEARVSHIGAAQ
jgi:hypothetical protein